MLESTCTMSVRIQVLELVKQNLESFWDLLNTKQGSLSGVGRVGHGLLKIRYPDIRKKNSQNIQSVRRFQPSADRRIFIGLPSALIFQNKIMHSKFTSQVPLK
jgi:hypothetical protein